MKFFPFLDFTIKIQNDSISCEKFEELPDYYGITITANKIKYQIIHNLLMGYRLVISDGEGMCQDIPFKEDTEHFLPEGVLVGRHLELIEFNNSRRQGDY